MDKTRQVIAEGEGLSSPPSTHQKINFFQFFFESSVKEKLKKIDFLMSRGGELNFSLSREFFDRTFGDKTWVSKQTLRVPCHRVFRHNFRPESTGDFSRDVFLQSSSRL